MADNTNIANGLKPIGYLSGAPYDGKVNAYLVAATNATAIGIGDPVTLEGTSAAAGAPVNGVEIEGMPTVIRSTAVSTPVGVVVGFLPNFSDLGQKHRAGSTARIVLVADSPDLLMEVQEDSLVSGIAIAEVGETADIVLGTVNTTTGNGESMLDSSTHATTGKTLKIMRLVARPGNQIGTGGITDKRYAKFVVAWAEHQYKSADGV